MASSLANQQCKDCAATPALQGDALRQMQAKLGGGWTVADGKRLEKKYKFKDFSAALDFTNRVGSIAEEQGHHPDIHLTYGEVGIEIWTHKIEGLTESDFILAAKINEIH